MSYKINLTDGTEFAIVDDGTVNARSSMTLVGKNYAGYGQYLDENFIHLLENSAKATAPSAPLVGQLWWDKTTNVLKVFSGDGTFKPLGVVNTSDSAPLKKNVVGDLWYDTKEKQLKLYNGSEFITIGPTFTASQGVSGAIVDLIADSSTTVKSHVIIKMFVQNTVVSIFSKDSEFTPADRIDGFNTIKPGLNMSAAAGSTYKFIGTATNADKLNDLDANSFMLSKSDTSTTGTLSVNNNGGITIGATNKAQLLIDANDTVLHSKINAGRMILKTTTTTGVLRNSIVIDDNITLDGNLQVKGNTVVISSGGTDGGITIGSSSSSSNPSASWMYQSASSSWHTTKSIAVGGGITVSGSANVSGTLTVGGYASATTPAPGNSSTTLATTAFVAPAMTFLTRQWTSFTSVANTYYNNGASYPIDIVASGVTALNIKNGSSGNVIPIPSISITLPPGWQFSTTAAATCYILGPLPTVVQ